MTDDRISIPLVSGDLDAEFPVGLDGSMGVDRPGTSALESERLGLLARPGAPAGDDRRLERWIASNLDPDLGDETEAPAPNLWNHIVEGLPSLRRPCKKPRSDKGAETKQGGWDHFQVAYRRGFTVVRLVDAVLVKESQIRELACDLLDLIEAGNHRVVLNFRAVERIGSWVAVVVHEARRRCEAGDGGALKICGLQPPLLTIFSLAGLGMNVGHYPDEAAAIDSPWPDASGPRPLPVEVLRAISAGVDIRPIRGGAPAETVRPAVARRVPSAGGSNGGSPTSPGAGVWLIVQVGGAGGRPVRVGGSRFLIGRDRSCHLRLNSAMVSKLHAAIEQRDDRAFLRDLGSTNGTIVNGRSIRSQEVEVRHGDRIQFGPVVATLACGPPPSGLERVEDLVATWLQGDSPSRRPLLDSAQVTEVLPSTERDLPAWEDPEPERRIDCEVIQDVVVVTPRVGELDTDATIEPLRSLLNTLFEQPVPRQVVVSLEYVGHISGHTIGVLLAHHLRLERAGGALRICQARARIMALLHQVRLTMLVDCYTTLDEAVLAAWPVVPNKPPMGG